MMELRTGLNHSKRISLLKRLIAILQNGHLKPIKYEFTDSKFGYFREKNVYNSPIVKRFGFVKKEEYNPLERDRSFPAWINSYTKWTEKFKRYNSVNVF